MGVSKREGGGRKRDREEKREGGRVIAGEREGGTGAQGEEEGESERGTEGKREGRERCLRSRMTSGRNMIHNSSKLKASHHKNGCVHSFLAHITPRDHVASSL